MSRKIFKVFIVTTILRETKHSNYWREIFVEKNIQASFHFLK